MSSRRAECQVVGFVIDTRYEAVFFDNDGAPLAYDVDGWATLRFIERQHDGRSFPEGDDAPVTEIVAMVRRDMLASLDAADEHHGFVGLKLKSDPIEPWIGECVDRYNTWRSELPVHLQAHWAAAPRVLP